MKIPTICRYCGGKIIKSTTRALYPKGSEPIYLCVNCNAYVGCYPEFVEKLNYIVQKLFMALRRDGRLAILVGDIRTKGSFYSMQHDLITRDEAVTRLGRLDYLSGIARSAFHFTAMRITEDGKVILFDSSRLFGKE